MAESDVYPYLMSTGRKEEEEKRRVVDSTKLIAINARGKKYIVKLSDGAQNKCVYFFFGRYYFSLCVSVHLIFFFKRESL